ncbi:immunoglobulin superfamily containing leucine-rich repeat protein-like [Branchiostoma lanceolatum]|uniref:immunoglobulin superfamily containing leucine-rich repeat protein-like n=1 Tax=Branchiostoma lanceolatum TaxID=7740 RepID=UPI003452D742
MNADVILYFTMISACAVQQTSGSDKQACDVCRCQQKGAVDCRNRDLLSVPGGIPVTTTSLRLQNNKLTWLLPGTFQALDKLESLELQQNKLERIDPGALDGLTALVTLDISHNQLTSLPAGVFVSLTSLQVLKAQKNEIVEVDIEALAGLEMLPHLQHVHLDNNRISHLPCEHLDVVPERIFLHFNGNPLRCDCLDVITNPPCLTRDNLVAECTAPRLLVGQTSEHLHKTCAMLFWCFFACGLSFLILGASMMYAFSRKTKRVVCNLYNCKFRFVHPRRGRTAWQ